MTHIQTMILFLFVFFVAIGVMMAIFSAFQRTKKDVSKYSSLPMYSMPLKGQGLHDFSTAMLRLLGFHKEKSAQLCKQRLDSCCSRQPR